MERLYHYSKSDFGDMRKLVEKHPCLKNIGRNFKHLAGEGRIRSLDYHPEKKLLVEDIEGDKIVWKNPSKDFIRKKLKDFKMRGVSAYGEKFDERSDLEFKDNKSITEELGVGFK